MVAPLESFTAMVTWASGEAGGVGVGEGVGGTDLEVEKNIGVAAGKLGQHRAKERIEVGGQVDVAQAQANSGESRDGDVGAAVAVEVGYGEIGGNSCGQKAHRDGILERAVAVARPNLNRPGRRSPARKIPLDHGLNDIELAVESDVGQRRAGHVGRFRSVETLLEPPLAVAEKHRYGGLPQERGA